MLHKQLKDIVTVIEQQAQNLHEEFNGELQVTQSDIEVERDTEAT
jgi:hypothetical protein